MMRACIKRKSTTLQSGAQGTIYNSTSAKPGSRLLKEGHKDTLHYLHQWSWGGAGDLLQVLGNQHYREPVVVLEHCHPGKKKKKKVQKSLFLKIFREAKFHSKSRQPLQSSNRKHPNWRHHQLTWFTKTTRTSLVPSTEHQWSEISQSPKDTKSQHPPNTQPVSSPCCHLTTDTEVPEADFRLQTPRAIFKIRDYNVLFVVQPCVVK